MLPERRLMAVRIRTDGQTQLEVQGAPVDATAYVTGLVFWVGLFVVSVIAGLL